jgi:hypothetical protein
MVFTFKEFTPTSSIKMRFILEHVHIIFEDKLVCTFDEKRTGRNHAKGIICGSPTPIISKPSIVEGPARPKEHIISKQMLKWICSLKLVQQLIMNLPIRLCKLW